MVNFLIDLQKCIMKHDDWLAARSCSGDPALVENWNWSLRSGTDFYT
jgi:hypothetical protein